MLNLIMQISAEFQEEKIKKERRTLNKTPLLLESVGFSMNNFIIGVHLCVWCVYLRRYVVLPKNSKKIRL